MTLQYLLTGGQLIMEKLAFSKELLLPSSPIKQFLKVDDKENSIPPAITKSDDFVIIVFDNASTIPLDEGFYDMFKKLKAKYREKIKGKVVIQITALTSFHVNLNLNTEDDKVIYES